MGPAQDAWLLENNHITPTEIGDLRLGMNPLVSGAAGATGTMASQITVIEDIQTGLENVPKTLRRLFDAKESRQADTQEFVAPPWRILVRIEAK